MVTRRPHYTPGESLTYDLGGRSGERCDRQPETPAAPSDAVPIRPTAVVWAALFTRCAPAQHSIATCMSAGAPFADPGPLQGVSFSCTGAATLCTNGKGPSVDSEGDARHQPRP